MGYKKSNPLAIIVSSTDGDIKSNSNRLPYKQEELLTTQAAVKEFDKNNILLDIIRNKRLKNTTGIIMKRPTNQRRSSEPHGLLVRQTLMTHHSLTLPPLHRDTNHSNNNRNSSRSSNCNNWSTVTNIGCPDGIDNNSLSSSSLPTPSSSHFVEILENRTEMAIQEKNRKASAFSVTNSNLENLFTSQKERVSIIAHIKSPKRIVTFLDPKGSTSPSKTVRTDDQEYGSY